MARSVENGSSAPPAGRGLAAGSFLTFVHLGLTVAALGPAMPFLATATSSSLGAVSSVFIAQNLGYMLGSFVGGRLYDRLPGTRLLSVAVWAMIPALALLPLARSLALLLAVVFLLGIDQGIVDVGGNLLILWTPPAGRHTRMNTLHLFFGLGAALCLLIMAQTVRLTGGIAWEYWSLAILAVPVALLLLRLPPIRGRHESVAAASGSAIQTWPLGVVLATLLIFLVVAAEGGYGAWIYSYAIARGLAGKVSAAYLTSVFWGAFTVGRLAATLLSTRLKPLTMLVGSLVGCLAAAASLLVWPQQPAAVWAGTAAFGLCVAPLFANIFNLAGDAMTLTGGITGIFLVGTSLGMLALPWLIGQLFEPLGPASMPVALLIALAAALLCCLLIGLAVARRQRGAAGTPSR
jgi:MFS transporter, FHS family, Na+ dependent glucose transporter 1